MRRIILAIAFVSLGGATPLRAQESVNYGSVAGRVLDASDAAVAETAVSLLHVDTNTATQVVTRADGRFRFSFLPLGAYELRATKNGFRPLRQRLVISAGSAFDVPVRLDLETMAESVTVEAGESILETARSQIAGTVSAEQIASLPLNGRNFLDIALLVPGVSPTNTGSNQLFAETSAVPGQGLSVSSQRNLSNSFIIDGVSANDDAAGLSGIPLSVDAVEQFQVVTSGGQAEFGRAIGGYVNVVTRMGTNDLHGSVYEYFREDALNAPNPLLGRTLPLRQHQFGGTLGGPLKRDRTFFFASLERRDLDQSGLVTISEPNVAIINARLRQVGFPGEEVTTGVYPNPVTSTLGLFRLDHLAGAHRTSLRYNLYDVNAENSRGAGGLSAPSASSALDNVDHVVALSHTWLLSDRTVNETRVQWAKGDLKAPATADAGPAVAISGVANFGTLSGSPTGPRHHHAGIRRHPVSHRGRARVPRRVRPASQRHDHHFSALRARRLHVLLSRELPLRNLQQRRLRADLRRSGRRPVEPESRLLRPGRVARPPESHRERRSALRPATPQHHRHGHQQPLAPARSRMDAGRVASHRRSGQRRPLPRSRSSARPRQRAPLRGQHHRSLLLRQTNVSLSPGQTGAPVFPNALSAAVATTTLPNLSTMDRALQNARSEQAGFEIEHQVDAWLVSVGGQYLRGTGLIASINQNVPGCVASGNNNGCRPNPAYANNSRYSSAARSSYQGMHVSISRRANARGSLRVSYTLSKAMNNVGEFFFSSPIDPKDIEKDWARSDDDQRHRLVVHGSLAHLDLARQDPARHPVARLRAERRSALLLRAAPQHHLGRDHGAGNGGPAHRRRPVHPAKRRRRRGLLQSQPPPDPLRGPWEEPQDPHHRRGVQPHQPDKMS